MYKASLVLVESPCWDKWANRIMWLCNLPLSSTEVFESTFPSKLCSATPIMAHLLKKKYLKHYLENSQNKTDHKRSLLSRDNFQASSNISSAVWILKEKVNRMNQLEICWTLHYRWRIEGKLHVVKQNCFPLFMPKSFLSSPKHYFCWVQLLPFGTGFRWFLAIFFIFIVILTILILWITVLVTQLYQTNDESEIQEKKLVYLFISKYIFKWWNFFFLIWFPE